MKRYIQLFLALSILLTMHSCGGQKKDNVVDLSDITPSSERYKEGNEKVRSVDTLLFADSLPAIYKGLIDSLQIDYSIVQKIDSMMFTDRFNAKSNLKMYWKSANDSVNFFHWNFKDSLKTKTALFNWLDCFGKNCKTIRVGEKVNFQKRTMLLLVNEKNMVFIDSDKKIDHEKWIKLLEEQKFGENWKYIVIQPKKGKASWLKYADEVFTEMIVE